MAMVQTVLLTAANMMVSWLIQQIIDLTTGVDIGFSFSELVWLSVVVLGLMLYYSPLLTLISIALSVLPLLASILTGNLVAKSEKKGCFCSLYTVSQ